VFSVVIPGIKMEKSDVIKKVIYFFFFFLVQKIIQYIKFKLSLLITSHKYNIAIY